MSSEAQGPTPATPPYRFMPERVWAVMEAKGLTEKEFLAKGFKRGWIHRLKDPDEPKASDAVRLAEWLETPVEYFFGAAPEYDGMDAWEVASRASLDVFLKRHPEGRQATRFRQVFEDHLAAHRENAPRLVARWAAALDLVVRARQQQHEELRRLDETTRSDMD